MVASRAMDLGLGVGERLEHRDRIVGGAHAQAGAFDHREDFAEMALGLRFADFDVELDRGDSADVLAPG